MPREKDRKEIIDFSYGQDSTSYPGVIAEDTARFPLLQNWHLTANGRLIRRNGYKPFATDEISPWDESLPSIKIDASLFNRVSRKFVFARNNIISGYAGPTLSSALRRMDDDGTDLDDVLYENDTDGFFLTPGYNISEDSDGKMYVAGMNPVNPLVDPANTFSGVVSNGLTAHKWGIAAPILPSINFDTPAGTEVGIPAPSATTDTGWYYFITYVNIQSGTLISESPPSPLPSARLTYTGDKVHTLQVAPSSDPQVTNIRIYRTSGDDPLTPARSGFVDGTNTNTAYFLKDVANVSATITLDYTLPTSLSPLNLLGTFDCYPYYDGGSPKPAIGKFSTIYKNKVFVWGYDNFMYYTVDKLGSQWKELFLFTDYVDFSAKVTSCFVYGNDLIVCTDINQTWRIVDGDFVQAKRLAIDGIAIIAHNTGVYDVDSGRYIALTNKGVRAWDGNGWSDDLAYQIKNDILSLSDSTYTFTSCASIINREYCLSMRSATESRIFVGFMNKNGTISWTVDNIITGSANVHTIEGSVMVASGNNAVGNTSYDQVGYGIMLITDGTGASKRQVVKFGGATDYDFDEYRIVCRAILPRLIHKSTDNNVRLRYVKLTSNLATPFTTTDEVPAILVKARCDNGKHFEVRKLIQEESVTAKLNTEYSSQP